MRLHMYAHIIIANYFNQCVMCIVLYSIFLCLNRHNDYTLIIHGYTVCTNGALTSMHSSVQFSKKHEAMVVPLTISCTRSMYVHNNIKLICLCKFSFVYIPNSSNDEGCSGNRKQLCIPYL